jgi:hypothetical protein
LQLILELVPRPETCSAIFVDFQTTHIATTRIAKPQVFDLLMTLFWLKTYPTKHQTVGTFHVGEKTVRNNVWKYIELYSSAQGHEGTSPEMLPKLSH